MSPFSFQIITQQLQLTHDNIPLIRLTTHIPQAPLGHGMARRFNRYYQAQRRGYVHYATHQLLPIAVALWVAEPTQIIRPFTATLSCEITYQSPTYVSLYTQSQDNLPPSPTVQRRGDTWDLHSRFPVPITTFLPQKHRYKAPLATLALTQIRQQETQGVALYHPNIGKSLLKRRLNPHHFYLTPEGLRFFYPMYAIAPAVEQVPSFLYPIEWCVQGE
ncbi:RsiV family protein [Bengtsoniella intestinalis]|uniref:RsiV family protein n=1 Tax=Bengtsoniella intestinalis TaxID=3073143 RepID=UPI00391F9371